MARAGLSFYDRKSADEYRTQLKSEGWDSTLKLDPNSNMWMVTKYGVQKKAPATDIRFTTNEPIMQKIEEEKSAKEEFPEEYKVWQELYRRRLTKKKFENWLEQEDVEKEVELEESFGEMIEEREKKIPLREKEPAAYKEWKRLYKKGITTKPFESWMKEDPYLRNREYWEGMKAQAGKREEELKGIVSWGGSIAGNIGEGRNPGKGLAKQAGIPHSAKIKMGMSGGGPRIGSEGAVGTGKPAIADIKTNISPEKMVVATPLPEETPLKESPDPKKLRFDKLGKGFAEMPKGLARKEKDE